MNIVTYLQKLFTKKPKIIVVLGATSTGKSDLAVDIALQHNGEVISADSRQVYRGLDLGSGKITTEEMRGVPHYLLDVADPKDIFNVQEFQNLGTRAIQGILEKNKLPIVCGGTGFYIDSLVYQSDFSSVPPNTALREKLEQKTLLDLQTILRGKTKGRLPNIDIQNKVRIVRAIEIIDELGYIPKVQHHKKYNVLFIGLTLPKDILDKRIHARIIKRLESGMLDEAQSLLKSGITHERLQSLGLEYRYMSKHILGEITHEEMIDNLYRDTVKFSKRQKTWFKRNKKIHWFNPVDDRDKIDMCVKKFII